MKKGRPGFILKVLASPARAAQVETAIFHELPTLGIRKQILERSVLDRSSAEVETEKGPVKAKKIVELDGSERIIPEFDERIRLSREMSIPVRRLNFPEFK